MLLHNFTWANDTILGKPLSRVIAKLFCGIRGLLNKAI